MERGLDNIEKLHIVANAVAGTSDNIIFVGGSVLQLYAEYPSHSDIRATIDIDIVVKIDSYEAYYNYQRKLRKLGFLHDTTSGAPICRMTYKGIIVDVMPTDDQILGFSNRWYKDGLANKIEKELPTGIKIFLLPPEYIMATKFEAMNDRAKKDKNTELDLRASHDLEDIIYLTENHSNILKSISDSPNEELKKYLATECQQLLKHNNIREIIMGHLPYPPMDEGLENVLNIFNAISML